MRVIEEFNIKAWKCTILLHRMRYTIKIEDGPLCQEYKVNQGDDEELLVNLKEHYLAADTIENLGQIFKQMRAQLPREKINEEEFDEII